MNLPVYMDNHATTKVDPRVLEAMLPYFSEFYGNAASTAHPYGWRAKEAVEAARAQVAALANCEPTEVIFTSGATESINLVLKGFARKKAWSDIRIITCVTEHSAVLDTCAYLEKLGAAVDRLPVQANGHLDLEALKKSLSAGADMVSLMHANNEIGTIHPIAEIAKLCRANNTLFHVDAAQSFGKLPISFADAEIDFLSVSGHKLYAPKGVGCLLIKRRNPPLRLTPLLHGGGHERGFRSGTLNVPGIVALGQASEICSPEMETESKRVANLRNELLNRLEAGIHGILLNGDLQNRLTGNLNVSIPGIDGQLLLPGLRDSVSVSSGSACTSATPRPSYVLAAIGISDELAHASLRFGIGRFNSENEIEYVADKVVELVQALRKQSS